MSDVISIVDGLDLVVALAEGHVHPDDVALARGAAEAARNRTGYPGGTLVVALVGGTGSGKSSILNALAGEPVASVGAIRPVTSEPLAWIPADAEPALAELLDRLGISRRVEHDLFPGLALLDLADIDSVEPTHRASVEELLPAVDGIIWVLDPWKYRDPVLHGEFVGPLADSAERFLFLVNQVDRIEAEAMPGLTADLRRALDDDGIAEPRIIPTAADPQYGSPVGIDVLADVLVSWVDTKRFQVSRILSDAHRATRALAEAAGVRRGGSLAFEERWAEMLSAVVTSLSLIGPTRGAMEEALCGLEDFVGHMAAEAGGPFGLRLRGSFSTGHLEAELSAAVATMERLVPRIPGTDAPIQPELRAAAAEILAGELQERVGAPLRAIVWERASLSAGVAGLGVELAMAEESLRRSAV
ncbi:50S ribosome-binding GTPase [bacterium]|nr:50S ribosome-binding GTPase [bacterium]